MADSIIESATDEVLQNIDDIVPDVSMFNL